ncbi:2-amino-4-hydroxy-6-hydroxymethyldihydropteridine diphosphokinase [Methylolobus aquaticus]
MSASSSSAGARVPEIFVGVGSNVDRELSIGAGLQRLGREFGPLRLSSVYESEAVGFVGDPFFNLVVGFDCTLPALEVAERLTMIEAHVGRIRADDKFAARTLDLDLLLYGNAVFEAGSLRIPRDDITRYAFVLEPLTELAADLVHPELGTSFATLWAAFDKRCLRQRRLDLRLMPN